VRHCAKGLKEQSQFTYHLFSRITGTKANMLLIIFLGLIAQTTLVAGFCDFGIINLKNFDVYQVGISGFTCLL
jgi:hypothetical protein